METFAHVRRIRQLAVRQDVVWGMTSHHSAQELIACGVGGQSAALVIDAGRTHN
jgi:hypothetical protein